MAAFVLAGDRGGQARDALTPTRDTIVALSSGRPPSAIAIMRLSGPAAFLIATGLAGDLPPSRSAALRRLRGADGGTIDRGLVLAFPGPRSATGEDVVELHAHGSPAVVSALLEAARAAGARLAEPGEFTRRAFDAGRLDLTQVEGLADLLAANTEMQRAQAQAQVEGKLRDASTGWRATLIELLADAEADLDFADNADVIGRPSRWFETLSAMRDSLARAAASFKTGERVREGLTIALVGAPNVGKSSLLNALAGREAAIVSATPGTTRDPVEIMLDLAGIPVTVVDTAGLREPADDVEAAGIARTRARAATADLVLHLAERTPSHPLGLVVLAKSDLIAHPPDKLAVSSRGPHGTDALMAHLRAWALGLAAAVAEPALVTRERQRDAIDAAATHLDHAILENEPVLRAERLRGAAREIARLSGAIAVDDILTAVFSRFCVGK